MVVLWERMLRVITLIVQTWSLKWLSRFFSIWIFSEADCLIIENHIDPLFFFLFEGKAESLIFQGGVFVDISFTTVGRNGVSVDQLDDKRKKDVENVLNDEFCSLESQENSCNIQNLEFRVKEDKLWDSL